MVGPERYGGTTPIRQIRTPRTMSLVDHFKAGPTLPESRVKLSATPKCRRAARTHSRG
jgi:hypothetical protein